MLHSENPLATLNLIGGRLCLDFVNTVNAHRVEDSRDYLTGYSDLIWWSERAGVLALTEVQVLLRRAQAAPEAEAEVFRRALALRAAIYRIFSAVAMGEAVQPDDLAWLNEELAQAMTHARIAPTAEGFAWEWEAGEAFDRMLWPVVRSAAELLTSGDLERIGECEGERCGWLYLDTSKNRSRRWCDMKDCGNRAKVRRHYRRTREVGQAAE